MADADQSTELKARVKAALAAKTPVEIVGHGSKRFYGNPVDAPALAIDGHRGVVNYEPTELVITARAGTPIADINAVLAEQNQMLAFEPPLFAGSGTIGGALATGLSGPRRPFWGSTRDMTLGIRLINGHGELMRFGGEVMKNVAGYDTARLNVAALGTLGIILEVSVKVLPAPQHHATIRLDAAANECHRYTEQWLREGRPVSAVCHDGDYLWVRLSGTQSALDDALANIDGEPLKAHQAEAFWQSVRDQTHAFFVTDEPIWRLSLPPAIDPGHFPGPQFIDWAGQQIWLRGDHPVESLRTQAQRLGGSVSCFRNAPAGTSAFQPLDAVQSRLHQRLKKAFDPQAIFNPGRLYPDLEEP